jgi:hypothetical protein
LISPDRGVAQPAARALAALLGDRDELGRLADAVRDPRIEPTPWRASFAREVAGTLSWAVRRSRRAADGPGETRGGQTSGGQTIGGQTIGAVDASSTVVALLPAHGFAVHLLRRAYPFAACGIRTVLGAHPHQLRDVNAVATVLVDALGVAGTLVVPPRMGRDAVALVGAGDLVVLTGAAQTFPLVRSATAATVIGACGGCSVAVGPDPDQLRRLGRVLRAHDQPGSCTRWGGWWQADPDEPTWRRPDGSTVAAADALAAAHPSVVYEVCAKPPHDEPARLVHGYPSLRCDPDGRVASLRGFGRDPRHGWPGDFML